MAICPGLHLSQVLPNLHTTSMGRPTAGPTAAAGSSLGPLHYVECQGPFVSPWALYRLSSVLQDDAGQDWDMFLTTEGSTSTVNLKPGAWEQGSGLRQEWQGALQHAGSLSETPWRQGEGKGLCPEEEVDWQQSAAQLQGRVVVKLGCRNGQVVAKLAE